MINSTRKICYVLVKSSRLHQMQASSILHIFNFIHLEPYVKLTILLCFVNITTVLIYSLQSFWILHIYCILCHPINFHFHITVHISLSLSQFLANSLHPSHSTRNTPSIWEQEAEVEGHFFLQFFGRSHIGLDRVITNLTLTITKMTITRCMYVSQKDLGWVTFEGNFETLLL